MADQRRLDKLRPLRHSVGPRPGHDGRWATHVRAEIRTEKGSFSCIVEDVSVAGARINVGAARVTSNHVFLLLEDYGALAARIVWRRRYRVGLQFAVRHPALLALAS